MLYKLSEQWERNGYHDSDWYVVGYDDEKDTISSVCVGTTRGCMNPPKMETPDDSILTKAREALIRDVVLPSYLNDYKNLYVDRGRYPVEEGETLYVSRVITTSLMQECRKCNATGKWVNPKNSDDVRQCFTCSGTSFAPYRLKDDNGNVVKVKIPRNLAGKVIRTEIVHDRFSRGYSFNKHYVWMNFDMSMVSVIQSGPAKVNLKQELRCPIGSLERALGGEEKSELLNDATQDSISKRFSYWFIK